MRGRLLSEDVITLDEITQIDALVGQAQMNKVLQIVLTSLQNKQAAKYKGFLLAMEESDDTLLQMKAKELGEWRSFTDMHYLIWLISSKMFGLRHKVQSLAIVKPATTC